MEFLIPILLADVLNPVLLAYLIYTAGLNKGVLSSCVGLLGHTVAYFSAGMVLLLGFERLGELLANPGDIDFAVSLVVGLLLLWVAYQSSRPAPPAVKETSTPPGLLGVFFTGAVINFIGLPFALPYFAAVDQIIKAELNATDSLLVLVAYNLAYALPFLLVPLLTAVLGEGSRQLLQRINGWVERAGAVLMPIMLGLLGMALVADSVSYFSRGEGLF